MNFFPSNVTLQVEKETTRIKCFTSLSTGNKLLTSCCSNRDAINWPPAANHGVTAIEIPTTKNNKDESWDDIMPCNHRLTLNKISSQHQRKNIPNFMDWTTALKCRPVLDPQSWEVWSKPVKLTSPTHELEQQHAQIFVGAYLITKGRVKQQQTK